LDRHGGAPEHEDAEEPEHDRPDDRRQRDDGGHEEGDAADWTEEEVHEHLHRRAREEIDVERARVDPRFRLLRLPGAERGPHERNTDREEEAAEGNDEDRWGARRRQAEEQGEQPATGKRHAEPDRRRLRALAPAPTYPAPGSSLHPSLRPRVHHARSTQARRGARESVTPG